MGKYVYLFELDSVRKTDSEIVDGQKALYNEIVRNGNVVVLTYNQIVDSRAFFSLLDNKKYYDNILMLFERGSIKISQYGSIRTIVQYLLNTIDNEDNKFIYSALPIKSAQRRLIALIKRSLINSDLSEINEYLRRIDRTETEVRDLFVEVAVTEIDGKLQETEKQSDLALREMDNVLENIYWLLGMVLRLSTLHNIFIPPRETSEYDRHKLKDYLEYVSKVEMTQTDFPLWSRAIEVLTKLNCWGSNNRSLYIREIKKASQDASDFDKPIYQYAEAIVNICTNYAYEMSICNISKHYNTSDLDECVNANSSFFVDFLSRLNQHWDNGNNLNERFLQNETNEFVEFCNIDSIPDFAEAARIAENSKWSILPEEEYIRRYEYNLKKQRRMHKWAFLRKVPRQVVSLLFGIVLVIAFNLLFEIVHNVYSGDLTMVFSVALFLEWSFETIVFLAIGEFITTMISKKYPKLLSLSESVGGIVQVLTDASHTLFKNTKTYTSELETEKTEKRNKMARIDFYEPYELKKYRAFYDNNPDLVTSSIEYPIADVKNREVLKRIIRSQELYKHHFGVVYNSSYNSMIVDPIMDGNDGYYAYERIVPSSKQMGVVLLTICKGKFVLIQQFRHANREEQLCFPRGFGEDGLSTLQNARKELFEELSAISITEPVELGIIAADSGLTSGKAVVYLVQIESYINSKDEGIRDIVELSTDEFKICVRQGMIDDGYTLGAYSLYSIYRESMPDNDH